MAHYKKNKLKKSFYHDIDGGKLYEQCYNPDTKDHYFEVFDQSSNLIISDYDDLKIEAVGQDMVESKIILLPTKAEKYGSEKELLKEVRAFIHKYVDVDPFYESLASYYVLLSWVYDCFDVLPYLRVKGDPGTGKTRFLITLGNICYKPAFAGGATTASPIFRIIEMFKGSLILDEADFADSEMHADIIKILNCGFMKDFPVLRTEGEKKREPKAYGVFGPKIISTRKAYKDLALESRMLTKEMEEGTRPDVPIILPKEFYKEAKTLRNKLLMFRFRNYRSYEVDPKKAFKDVEKRLNQILLPLLTIIIDKEVLEDLRNFAVDYNRQQIGDRGMSIAARVLRAIVALHEADEELIVKDIAEKTNELEGLDSKDRFRFTPQRVGRINGESFHFERKRGGATGNYILIVDIKRLKILCRRYDVELKSENKTVGDMSDEELGEVLKEEL